ncbi:hypothetical protein PHSY_001478 [Pseudozyma hubeiensis SY62]|uniref:Zn(2)-C6 fungal-type domain-containing protein n=1 Tax=Pseudozyma hubeiensis (strain SY62) TaxID=1305764 RepID=R9P755_PSEHS|nr:hypothetical protein PHSY_001478 [Pseudozyma hubeiensis SY62]GAC93910.1 hypothetical protein PHSY_001478 [Pseudozyma hubeiensis SY62]
MTQSACGACVRWIKTLRSYTRHLTGVGLGGKRGRENCRSHVNDRAGVVEFGLSEHDASASSDPFDTLLAFLLAICHPRLSPSSAIRALIMVLAVAAPHKRRRLDSSPSDSDDHDDDDHLDSSRSPSPAAGAQAIAKMISSQRHPYHQSSSGMSQSGAINGLAAAMDAPASSSSSSAPTSKHQCDVCSKTFARHEHMLRHRASHTDSASYVCDDCGKRFRRSDVLQRHRRLHAARKELSLDINSSKLTKRQKSALARVEAACLRCSSKKLKCDAQKPSCSRCLRKPDANCVYPSSSVEPSPSSPQLRNRSASVMDDSWMPDSSAELDFSVDASASPVPTSTPYPAQAQAIDPASFSATGSSISTDPFPGLTPSPNRALYLDQSSSMSTDALPAHQPFCPNQRVHFAAPAAAAAPPNSASSVQDPSRLAAHADATTPRSFHQAASSLHNHQASDTHVIGATPGLVDMVQNTATILQPPINVDDRTLNDLLGWLDGPKALDTIAAGQIDWIFGDSPEAPQLLDWSQMQDWANFNLAAVPGDSAGSDVQHPPFATTEQHQPPASLHQHRASIEEAIPHQSPLFVLSSAAEMIDPPYRTPQTRSQHLAHPRSSISEHPAASPRVTANSPRNHVDHVHGGAGTDSKAVAGRRSRWNSPELADDDTVPSDSAKSDPYDSKRDGEDAAQIDATRAGELHPSAARHPKSTLGRRAAAIEAWPNRWNPAIKVNSLPTFSFVKATEEHLMSEDMAHVKSVGHTAMLRMAEHLRNAASDPLEQERFDAAFATLDAATLNIYLQLFFHHCYSYLPAIHQVTFHPDRCDPRLLAALCAVGAFFSEVPGSRNAAIYLASLTQMSVSRATLSNNALARVTSTFQSIALIYMIWRSVGVPSRQEYAEAFRSTYCTMIRRCRLLENISPPRLPAETTLDERWTAWVSWESGRRTAWSTLVSETELSMHWNLPEPFAPDELTGKLPCDDRLWEAPTAIEWAQMATSLSSLHRSLQGDADMLPHIIGQDSIAAFTWPDNSYQLDVARVCDVIQRTAKSQSVSEAERESIARLSPFSRLCVGSAVMLSTHHTMKMVRLCSMLLGDEEQARERMRKYLAAATEVLSTNQARDARVDLLLHAIQLFELISPETLQVLSCRRGVPRMHAARRQLSNELNEVKPWKTASIVFHAGQMLRLAKQSLQRAPVECLHIFYAAIALQAVSLLVLQQDAHAPPAQIVRITFNGPARSAAPRAPSSRVAHDAPMGQPRLWRADSTASGASSTSPSSVGGGAAHSTAGTSVTGTTPTDARWPAGSGARTTFMLESVGNLAHPMAPEKVLSLASKWLRANDGVGVWPIGQSLAKILDSLATLTPK